MGKLVEDRYVGHYRVAIFIAAVIDAPVRDASNCKSVSFWGHHKNTKRIKSLLSKVNKPLISFRFIFRIDQREY